MREDLGVFFERIRPLEPHLGAILYQLPPSLKIHLDLLAEFLKILPPGLDQAVEFRHSSWLAEDTFSLLAKYNLAYCIISMPNFPKLLSLPQILATSAFMEKTPFMDLPIRMKSLEGGLYLPAVQTDSEPA